MIRILEGIDRWECVYKECGARCCGEGIEITLSDIKRICGLGKRWNEFARYDEDTHTFRLKGEDGRCVFVDEDLKCSIRENEPVVCRLLPFRIVEVSYSDEPIMKLEPVVDCPGEGVGRMLDEEFRAQIENNALSVLRENQELIKRIKRDGVESVVGELIS